MIDEESHPGVLAEMLHSSSSSDTSSDDDSDATSGSNTTVKRIRNALRKKRRRKSSFASKENNSLPSLPSFIRTVSSGSRAMDTSSVNDASGTVPGYGTNAVDADPSGDLIVPEKPQAHPTNPSSEVTSRDFETAETKRTAGEFSQKITTKPHSRRKLSRGQKAREKTGESDPEARPCIAPVPSSACSPPEGLVNDIDVLPGDTQRRSFNLRNLPRKPTLPRVLASSMLASSAQPAQLEMPSHVSATKSHRSYLRRTSSLPDRLNGTLVATSIPSAQPLPHLLSKKRVEIKEESEDKPKLSRTSALILLLVTTGLVAVCAEFLVDSIDYLVKTTGISQAFVGLIILPIVGNAAEHITAVTVASKNKMDLAIGVALGSSIQIALFVTPVIVLLGWCLNTEMSLYFSLFETISLFASAFIVNYLMLDGRSNYLEGALLIAAYVIIAVAAFFYPSCENTSTANGGPFDASCH
jgi:Ca2+:H+ antiporter